MICSRGQAGLPVGLYIVMQKPPEIWDTRSSYGAPSKADAPFYCIRLFFFFLYLVGTIVNISYTKSLDRNTSLRNIKTVNSTIQDVTPHPNCWMLWLLFTFKLHKSNSPEKKIGSTNDFKCRKPHPKLKMTHDRLVAVFFIYTIPLVRKHPDTFLVR